MKRGFSVAVFLILAAWAFSATKIPLENGIKLVFEGCADGSVRFEALAKKAKAPAKEFELKRPTATEQFVRQADGSFLWNAYSLVPRANGYTLLKDGEELYTSVFTDDGKLLRELRTWKTAVDFYGLGEASRTFNLRNMSFTIYNVSKYGDHAFLFIPFYVTNTGTSVYYNANGKDNIYFQDESDPQVYRTAYKRIECFVRQDNNAEESVRKFYAETKTSCILPHWAYGYIQSKYGYQSTQEVTDLVTAFKQKNIPLSAVVLDLYWFKKMGDIFWTSPDFADYKQMNDFMEENGVKLITITEPFFSTMSQNYAELASKKLLCKTSKGGVALWHDWWCIDKDREGGLFNPLAKNATQFMGQKYAAMLQSGIDGFWTDLGEPEGAPATVKYGKYAEEEFHNYYNYYWTKSLYDGVKQHEPDRRLFILSRSGYTGIGKYNVSVWSGDVSVSWPALASQVAYGLNAGLSGLAYWGSDVGGFVQPDAVPELYVRWQQFGAFTPVYRAHGTGPREPWIFGQKETAIVKKYIDYRMQLLPYVYSTARQTMAGLPMMRPMFYIDEQTPQEYLKSQYMFGDSLLVAPVVREKSEESERTLWLPEGDWYNFETFEKTTVNDSGKTVTVPLTLESIPVYVKGGSVLPMQKDDAMYLYVFPKNSSEETSFTLYNDDGETEQYKNGAFTETTFTLTATGLSAKTSQNRAFQTERFIVAVPLSVKTGSGWQQQGPIKTKTVTLQELEQGIKF